MIRASTAAAAGLNAGGTGGGNARAGHPSIELATTAGIERRRRGESTLVERPDRVRPRPGASASIGRVRRVAIALADRAPRHSRDHSRDHSRPSAYLRNGRPSRPSSTTARVTTPTPEDAAPTSELHQADLTPLRYGSREHDCNPAGCTPSGLVGATRDEPKHGRRTSICAASSEGPWHVSWRISRTSTRSERGPCVEATNVRRARPHPSPLTAISGTCTPDAESRHTDNHRDGVHEIFGWFGGRSGATPGAGFRILARCCRIAKRGPRSARNQSSGVAPVPHGQCGRARHRDWTLPGTEAPESRFRFSSWSDMALLYDPPEPLDTKESCLQDRVLSTFQSPIRTQTFTRRELHHESGHGLSPTSWDPTPSPPLPSLPVRRSAPSTGRARLRIAGSEQ